MLWTRGQPYRYNLAEWLGVFFALIGTPPLVWLGLFARMPTPSAVAFFLGWGGIAVAGWVLLAIGTRAHHRASGPNLAGP